MACMWSGFISGSVHLGGALVKGELLLFEVEAGWAKLMRCKIMPVFPTGREWGWYTGAGEGGLDFWTVGAVPET